MNGVTLRCLDCEYVWEAFGKKPVRCPACHSKSFFDTGASVEACGRGICALPAGHAGACDY